MNPIGARTMIYEVLDDRFRACSSGDQQLETLHEGCRWAEGPLYVPASRYLVWSDISALRDHWRAAFDPLNSPTATSEWHRVLAQPEPRLREWGARTGCTPAMHRPDVKEV
jgi:sugar lactone lactonase YvrE